MDDVGDFHLRVTGNGWITMDCKACGKPVVSATHMDVCDFTTWARRHLGRRHPDGVPENITYRCPLTGEVED